MDVHRSKKPLVNTDLGTEAHILTPPYGQYLTHVHNHITPAGAAMDSCFGVIGAHQTGSSAWHSRQTSVREKSSSDPWSAGQVQVHKTQIKRK